MEVHSQNNQFQRLSDFKNRYLSRKMKVISTKVITECLAYITRKFHWRFQFHGVLNIYVFMLVKIFIFVTRDLLIICSAYYLCFLEYVHVVWKASEQCFKYANWLFDSWEKICSVSFWSFPLNLSLVFEGFERMENPKSFLFRIWLLRSHVLYT